MGLRASAEAINLGVEATLNFATRWRGACSTAPSCTRPMARISSALVRVEAERRPWSPSEPQVPTTVCGPASALSLESSTGRGPKIHTFPAWHQSWPVSRVRRAGRVPEEDAVPTAARRRPPSFLLNPLCLSAARLTSRRPLLAWPPFLASLRLAVFHCRRASFHLYLHWTPSSLLLRPDISAVPSDISPAVRLLEHRRCVQTPYNPI